jgi:hypothetical protein
MRVLLLISESIPVFDDGKSRGGEIMRKIIVSVLFFTGVFQAYEVTSIDLSNIAVEYPRQKRVVLGAVTDRFPVSTTTIHALVHFKGVGEHDPITLRWIKEGQTAQRSTILGEAEGELDPHTTILHVFYNNDDLSLSPGRYAVEILREGRSLAKKEFTLYKPNPKRDESIKVSRVTGISQIYLAKGIRKNPDGSETPVGLGDHFEPGDHRIWVLIPYENLPEGTPYSLELIIVDNGMDQDVSLYKKSGVIQYPPGKRSGTLQIKLHLPNDWPDGIYEVILRIGGKVAAVKRFTIGNLKRIKERSVQPVTEKIGLNLQKHLIGNLAKWMLETIEKRDTNPLYAHAVHYWRDRVDWKMLRRSFQSIFDAPMDWKSVFLRTPKLLPVLHDEHGAVILRAVYPGDKDTNVLLKGKFLKENGEWRLFGFGMEPIRKGKE